MKIKSKLLLMAALFVLVLPLIITGTASAKYMSDGAVQNGATGGWVTPNDMMCIVGVHADGTLDIADGVTSARDCIYLQTGTMNGGTAFDLTGITTQAACTDTDGVGSDGAKHSWATSFCTKSLTGLDRTQQMCEGISGTWVTTGKCVAYGRDFKGQDANGTPLPIGTEGTDSTNPAHGKGFCYTSFIKTDAAASCPSTSTNSSTAFGYTVAGTDCVYSFGIAGDRTSALTKADGTANGPIGLNMASYTTQGDCIANGGSWSNWIPAGTTATAPNGATIMTFDLTTQAVNADEGCLHCHSTKTEYNGPAERFKDSYLKTGHKNMLRKVTAGKNWAGPDGAIYTAYAAGTINWTAGTAQVSGVDKPLLYIFGDWMAPAPAGLDVIVDMGVGTGAKYNGVNNYSCAPCHSTGWSNPDPAKGLCTLSSKTTQLACTTAGGVWTPLTGVEAIGTPGITQAEPAASFPGINFNGAGTWNLDGITCGRCHNATVPSVSAAQIAASAFPTTYPTSGGMGNIPSGPAAFSYSTGLCYSCHQSIAKTSNGIGADADLSDAAKIPVKDADSGPGYIPEFSGHVLGGSFLNSVHARYTGSIVPNSLGKYDLAAGGTYSSQFKGYTCWQSSSSSSPAKTQANGEEIKDKTTCETLYGAGAWRAEAQGGCSTCHDVHQSLFVAGQEGLRKECESCHENNSITGATVSGTKQVDVTEIYHPTTGGTPFDTNLYVNACEVCHMPKATSGGFPMHVWRINTDAAYSTFPTACEFGVGVGCTATKKNANTAPDGAYANAVWVDLDLACGQCHGGSAGQTATKNNAPYMNKAYLAMAAAKMHESTAGLAPTAAISVSTAMYVATLTDSSTPGATIVVNWGDGQTSNGNAGDVLTHTYATAGTFNILDTADAGGLYDSAAASVSVPQKFSITVDLTTALPAQVEINSAPGGNNDGTCDAGETCTPRAKFMLKKNGTVKQLIKATDDVTFTNVKPGTYKLQIYRKNYTFDCNGPLVVSGNATVICTPTLIP